MRILAIDPGPGKSGWVLYGSLAGAAQVLGCGIDPSEHVLDIAALNTHRYDATVAVEMIASYGMPVGREVFETCVWVGRIQQACKHPDDVRLVYRKDVKMHLCGSPKAKDANIKQALIDRLGPQGTKKKPGPTYGIRSHAWAALAVAVYVADMEVAR